MAETISQAQSGAVPLTEDMYTKKGVDELIAQTVKGGITPKGSVAFANLPTPGSTNVGWMYNVEDAFTTTSAFVEGEGKKFPAGTNVYVVNPSSNTYKWDVLPGEGPQPGTSTPAANGTASAGSAAGYAREDHVHPTDTTRQAKITASGILKGNGSGGVSAAVAGTDYVAPVSGKGLSTNDYTTAEKNKLTGIEEGAQANTVEGVKLNGATDPLTPDSTTKVVTIPDAVATGTTGATNGLMTAADKAKLDAADTTFVHKTGDEAISGKKSFSLGSNVGTFEIATGNSTTGDVVLAGSGGGRVELHPGHIKLKRNSIEGGKSAYVSVDPNSNDRLVDGSNVKYVKMNDAASTSQAGVVQLSDSTSSTSTSLAATANAVKAAKDAADAVGTRVAAIEAAAGALLTNLSNAALADASMTSANTIKTAVLSLIDFLKAFAASSDNDASTTHTVGS